MKAVLLKKSRRAFNKRYKCVIVSKVENYGMDVFVCMGKKQKRISHYGEEVIKVEDKLIYDTDLDTLYRIAYAKLGICLIARDILKRHNSRMAKWQIW